MAKFKRDVEDRRNVHWVVSSRVDDLMVKYCHVHDRKKTDVLEQVMLEFFQEEGLSKIVPGAEMRSFKDLSLKEQMLWNTDGLGEVIKEDLE